MEPVTSPNPVPPEAPAAPPSPGTDGGSTPKPGKLGLVALILAIVGTIFACWEGAYIVGWVLLPASFVVSIVAIVKNSRRKLGVIALVLSIVGTIAGVVAFTATVGKAVDEAFSSASIPAAGTVATAGVSSSDGADASADSSAGSQEQGAASFKDGVYKGDGVSIAIKGHRIVNVGEAGNEFGEKPLLVIDYMVTNESSKNEVTPADFLFVFQAYQDTDPNSVNKLEVGVDTTLYDTYGDIGSQAIKVGGSVDYAVAYQLDDTTTPVELAASTILGGEIGRQTITLP